MLNNCINQLWIYFNVYKFNKKCYHNTNFHIIKTCRVIVHFTWPKHKNFYTPTSLVEVALIESETHFSVEPSCMDYTLTHASGSCQLYKNHADYIIKTSSTLFIISLQAVGFFCISCYITITTHTNRYARFVWLN